MTNLLLGLAPVILGIPSAMLAFTDYQHRKRQLAATGVIGRGAPASPAPPAVALPERLAHPTVRPNAAAHFRTTIDLAEPLSFPRRLLATVIDGYGGLIVAAILAGVIVNPNDATEEAFNTAFGLLWLLALVGVAAMNAHGRSPGKMLTGGTLTRYSNRGESVGFWRSLGRLGLALIVPFSFWFVLGSGRRTAHDRITDTVVVRSR